MGPVNHTGQRAVVKTGSMAEQHIRACPFLQSYGWDWVILALSKLNPKHKEPHQRHTYTWPHVTERWEELPHAK
jgi:hypothetical protein